ncbi:hypothetical protein [Listeria booriae]|uniref:hypothetical protein n=1 Tax=Listeria booriae TaxID=1552123 RepID=UPI001624E0D9|nr:hypothetical protein [Listeria booriae]MBC2196403.1 hypothetical protein [Listeria booriae]
MDVSESIKQVNKIEQAYEEIVIKKLDTELEKFTALIKNELNKYSQEKGITIANSVYSEIHPFSLKGRVKDSVSLKEKIVRNSTIAKIHHTDPKKIEKNIYSTVDDIIGVTILLDTNKNLELIADFFFNKTTDDIKVLSNKSDSKKFFSNILYYNIKIVYKDIYPIEVQIKSNLLSSYADLEHKLIYKDNRVSVVKQVNSEVIQAIVPNIVAIENVIDTVEKSSRNDTFQEIIIDRQKYLEKAMSDLHGDDYDLISSYLGIIDFLLYRSYIGSNIVNKCLETDFDKFVNYVKDLTEVERTFLYDKDENNEVFLGQILVEYIKEFKEFVRNLLVAEIFNGKEYSVEQEGSDEFIGEKIKKVDLIMGVLESENLGDISLTRRLFNSNLDRQTGKYTNFIYDQLFEILEVYLDFVSEHSIKDDETNILLDFVEISFVSVSWNEMKETEWYKKFENKLINLDINEGDWVKRAWETNIGRAKR